MMKTPLSTWSPQVYARIGGVVYLFVILFGGFAEGFVASKLIVAGDPSATAQNILASRGLWEIGLAANLIVPILAVIGVWISYVLLKPVSPRLIILDVFFTLMALAIEAVSKLFLFLVVPILSSASYAKAFEPRQLESLATLALKSHDVTFNITLVFFGISCVIEGYLIYKSAYFPKFIGVLMQLAGVSYLISYCAALFAPGLAAHITPASLMPALVGESAYCLWLLFKGVNLAKWNERVGAERASA
jgi:hypothetical protein